MDNGSKSDAQLGGSCGPRVSQTVAIENVSYSPSEDCYDTKNRNRGIALVFNHFKFTELKQRIGTDKDRDAIVTVLKELKFDVHVYDDLSQQKVLKNLKLWSQQNHLENDCLVVVVMTHGGPDMLYANDKSYSVYELWANFTETECPSLIGKPKLFFIQACRGEAVDKGVQFNPDQPIDMVDSKKNREPNSVPPMADLLLMYSTYEGHYSWRNENGTWFIQSLCKELKENGKDHDLLTLLTGVSRRVAYEYQSNVPDDKMADATKQMPCVVSKLTKSFYFTEKSGTKR